MNVLLITFNYFPDIAKELRLNAGVNGGWVYALTKSVLEINSKIKLGVATPYSGREFKIHKINGINYYLIPSSSNKTYNTHLEPIWIEVKEHFNPDIIHIYGSEYPFALSYLKACGSKGVVLTIQGLVSVIEKYYLAGMSNFDIRRNITIRDILRMDTLFSQKKNMKKRGVYEVELIKNIKHAISCTDWDKAHTSALNPDLMFHYCNYTLRDSFYKNKWNYENCEKYSIIVSQGYYPLKGLHQLLFALPIVIKRFPETKVYVVGVKCINSNRFKINGYGKYVKSIIGKLGLEKYISFVGPLNEDNLTKKLLDCNVFVSPSSIENHSIATGEAQILGVPTISSFVGGLSHTITHGITGLLYRFDEPELLAWEICKLFSDPQLMSQISENGIIAAKERHDPLKNAKALNDAYAKIFDSI